MLLTDILLWHLVTSREGEYALQTLYLDPCLPSLSKQSVLSISGEGLFKYHVIGPRNVHLKKIKMITT